MLWYNRQKENEMDKSNVRELAQNKIIILYIVKRLGGLFTEEELIAFILKFDIYNYFYFKEYLNELIDSKLVAYNSENNIIITNDGIETLEYFSDNIGDNLKENLNEYIDIFKKQEIYNNVITANYYEENEKYYCNLSIKEQEKDIFFLKIEAPDREYAKNICEKFKNNPQILYKNIISVLSK